MTQKRRKIKKSFYNRKAIFFTDKITNNSLRTAKPNILYLFSAYILSALVELNKYKSVCFTNNLNWF